jgi:uncharacterized protein DUF6869
MPPPDPEIAGLTQAWISYQRDTRLSTSLHEEHSAFWSVNALIELSDHSESDRVWLAIRELCARADKNDGWVIAMIGASPLEDFVARFGDHAMDLIEPELGNNSVLWQALANVSISDASVRRRRHLAVERHSSPARLEAINEDQPRNVGGKDGP